MRRSRDRIGGRAGAAPGGDLHPGAGPLRGTGADRAAIGSLSIRQPPGGYRFSLDSVLLAAFAAPFCGGAVLDLGTGSGIILLLLARMCPGLGRGVGVEIQRDLYEHALGNIERSRLSGRLTAVHGDYRERVPGLAPGSFDLVVSNPPYRRLGEGRRNPDPGKETARHEVAGTLDDLVRAAGRYLSSKGRFAMTGLPRRLPEMLAAAAAAGIFPGTLRFVHPFAGRSASLVLFAGSRRRGSGPDIVPPLVVYAGRGVYHPEVEGLFEGITREGGS